jgi:hypothetical protein
VNPSYSHATPPGIKDMPDYWKTLLAPVSADKSIPHLRKIRIRI